MLVVSSAKQRGGRSDRTSAMTTRWAIALLASSTVVGVGAADSKCGVGPQFRHDPSVPQPAPVTLANPIPRWQCESAPTNVSATVLRPGAGVFRSGRVNGSHTGVDIMLRDYNKTCVLDTTKKRIEALEVYAVADGVVAYSRLNTSAHCPEGRPEGQGCDLFTTGLGHTVIIDHGNGIYSLYAHMAQIRDPRLCLPRQVIDSGGASKVKVGDKVAAGQVIGYMGSLGPGLSRYEMPSGNAAVVEERVQLHFEFFSGPIGKRSTGGIFEIVPKQQRGQINPTSFLNQFYQ